MSNEIQAHAAMRMVEGEVKDALGKLTRALNLALCQHHPVGTLDREAEKGDRPLLCELDHERWPCKSVIGVLRELNPVE